LRFIGAVFSNGLPPFFRQRGLFIPTFLIPVFVMAGAKYMVPTGGGVVMKIIAFMPSPEIPALTPPPLTLYHNLLKLLFY
jgi:hypothetical protein